MSPRSRSNLEAATEHWLQHHGAFSYVTPAGDMLSRQGVYTGGATNGHDASAASLLGRKNQIAELQSQLQQVQLQIAERSRH